jgi:hypothetical protein
MRLLQETRDKENGTVLFFKRVTPRLNVLRDDEYSPFPSEYILHTSICLLWLNSHHIPERSLPRILHIRWVSMREGFPVFGN